MNDIKKHTRKILTLIFLNHFIISCVSAQPISLLKNDSYKGHIKSEAAWSYTANMDSITGKTDSALSFKYFNQFNKSGNIVKCVSFEASGSLSDSNVFLSDSEISVYDSSNNNIETDIYKGNGSLLVKEVKQFDSSGHQLKEVDYNEVGMVRDSGKKIYDKQGNCIEFCTYDNAGSIMTKENYTYDKKNNMIGKRSFTYMDIPEGINNQSIFSYKYDDNGNAIEEDSYDPNSDSLNSKITFEYDNKGNETYETRFHLSDRSVEREHRYIYTYDNEGNWIHRIALIHDKPWIIGVRDIKYY